MPDPALREGGKSDAPLAAEIHADAFAPRERSWTATEFAGLLELPGTFLLLAAPAGGGGAAAVLLGRVQGEEAEILTIGARPAARRSGLARALLARFAQAAAAGGAQHAFLEVAEDNSGARALYAGAGWGEVGARKGYVRRNDGRRVDAMVMRITLG
jgi:ribosomal-protein-alanine N-acetyltransferase